MSPDAFYELPIQYRNALIAFHGKAKKACEAGAGFAGEIVFLDNGEGVYPRYIVAKYPKRREGLSPRERAVRFLRELELQASAHYHPNVHWPFKVFMILGVPIAYFRRWEGDLSHYIEEPSFGDIGRICLITQLVAGLLHCHRRSLAHQDLKPENIFVRDLRKSFQGLPDNDLWLRPLVADFGSVNLAAEKQEFGGTRPYMAPEQWKRAQIGEWTSVFVAGIMLHELLSRGVHPIGVHGGDWHRQINPGFNRWQKNKYWIKWLEMGCNVKEPLPHKDLAVLVADCLRPNPDDRPILADVQHRLQCALSARSSLAADQVSLFLALAEQQTSSDWAHLTQQLRSLRKSIETQYP
ncbi:protein kinase [Roseomonas stagni]|uniref:Protein kinase n=1 Tax=Falsiroseomonas algicola TaxID=2716930 RepID=A0A6M1LLU2_9PROT|nr:protein kinase [Falsiroseomonas algicola]NGM21183.1 protein kinase [Falsiroseomonas algicola]